MTVCNVAETRLLHADVDCILILGPQAILFWGIQMPRIWAALSSAILLTACSGGGGSSSGGGTVVTPTPSPGTPTPSPSASSTPTPSYTKFAELTGDRSFTSACGRLDAGSPPVVAPASLPTAGLSFAYVSATQTWTVIGDGVNLSFGPTDVDPATPAGGQFYLKPGVSGTDRLRIQLPGITGVGPMEYARIASVTTNVFGTSRTYSCVIGVPTLVTDVPAATTVTYRAALGGTGYRTPPAGGATTTFSLGKSTVALDANRVTGKVIAVINLIGTPTGGGADVDFGTVTGTADIDPATGGYYGTSWTSPTLTVIFGAFSGRFFGPQGLESEFALSLVIDAPGAAPFQLRTVSTVVAIR
jgi:hypothetical protein